MSSTLAPSSTMIPSRVIGRSRAASGGELTLSEHDGEYTLRVDNWELMSSRKQGSEEAMAEVGCQQVRTNPAARVLVSGLGLGYSLRAALDVLHPEASVTVAEYVPEIIEWHAGPLGPLAGHPLDDPRVTLYSGDVRDVLTKHPNYFDVILLDLDNGPQSFIDQSPKQLYSPTGLTVILRALKGPKAVLVIWAAGHEVGFEKRMRQAGFSVEAIESPERKGGRGGNHVLYKGKRR